MSTGRLKMGRAALIGALVILGMSGPAAWTDPSSPITIDHVDSPDPVASGAQLTYTTTIVNTGGSKITNVVLSNQVNGVGGIGVPPQLVLTSTRGSCTQNVNLVSCSAGQIEGGGSWTVTIRGVVTASAGTTINNTVSVSGTRSAQNFNTTATTTTLVSGGGGNLPDLSIAKTGPTSVPVSTPMTYTLTVNNGGTLNAAGVKVVDTVPAGLTGITASATSLFTCSVSGQTVTCTGGAVNQGSNATITINATSPAVVGTITNTASVDPDNTIPEANELNNTSALVNTQVTTGPPPPAIAINLTDNSSIIAGAGPDPVNPGATLTYKILVTNTASTRADDVVLVNGTQGLEAASITVTQVITNGTEGNSGGCTVMAPQVRCVARTLNAGGTILYTITGQVVASAGSTIIDTASVTGNIHNTGYTSSDTELTTVKPDVDLTITKGDSPDPVCARSWPTTTVPAPTSPPLLGPPVCLGGLTYTLVVGNSGITTAVGVVVRDPLPMGTVLDNVVAPAFFGGCAVDGATNVLTCSGGVVGPESTTTITIVVVAPPYVGTINNTATVDPNNAIFEADETNNIASQSTMISTGIDLTILKTDVAPGFDPIATNGTQTYTITVDNIGTQDATGIKVRDFLPANTRFRSAVGDNGFTCSHSAGVVECSGGSILGTASEFYPAFGAPGNDTATIVIRVFAQPNVGTGVDGMHNEVRVDPDNAIAEVNEANNIDFEDTDVISGGGGNGAFNELTIVKTQTVPPKPPIMTVARNALVTWNLAVSNGGTDPAVGVTVRDFLPAGARYVSATGPSFICTEQAAFIQCVGGQIPAGGTVNITLRAFAPDTPGTYINQAVVDPDNTVPEGNEFNNESSIELVVVNGGPGAFNDLQIEKTGTGTTTPGGTISYTLQVWNSGTDAAANVAVRDVLPAGTTFVSAEDSVPATPGAFTCAQAGGVIDCTGATLNPGVGNARFILIEVTAPNTNLTLTNQAFVDPDNQVPEGDELNNTDTHDTTVQSVINLKIEKDGPDTASQSDVVDYVITVTNEKPSGGGTGATAFGVVMHDPLPVGLIPLAVDAGDGNNWACQILENPINVVDCLGDLNPDQTVTVTITVFVTAENNRSLDNQACVDPDDVIEEFVPPGETDNCSTHTTPVGPNPKKHPDLAVEKTVSPTEATPDQDLTYTVTVQNIGDADAQGPVTVTDEVPLQTTFVSAAGTGWTCPAPVGGVITCQLAGGLAQGATADPITIVVHVDVTATSSITNSALAAPAVADPTDPDAENETNLDNNSDTVVAGIGSPAFDLSIADIVDNPDPAVRGQQVTYTVIGLNTGSDPANGVIVRVALPPTGAILIGAAGSNGFNCGAPASGNVDCTGDLPGGGSTTITLNFLVSMTASADLSLTATIDPGDAFPEPDNTNNSQTETTTVSGTGCADPNCVDLVAAQLHDSVDPVATGGNVTYTLVIANTGAFPATLGGSQLAFFDLFGNVTLVAYGSSDPAIACSTFSSTSSQLLSDCFGDLGPGQSVTLTIEVTVNGGSTVTAKAEVDPGHVVAEFNDYDPGPPPTWGNNLIFQVTNVTP
jgi:uncharacterized repeat protein (TIGR01451 family)